MNLDRAHGFVRSTDGTVTTIDPPGDVDGTYAESINTKGTIVGFYYDSNHAAHGFLWTP
jgi:probable HAF family extracellular repeat protein